ncbi:MAG: hypothetical protein BAJALOKI2v1_70035 [Promethearchaeota archaeon]|nr:MAG: hypothetical protein BAJALOKI2v1_70035 [Candidatus Lokiarchaeota archaeon]
MDTKHDFLTAEFLHILFFQQKNLLIYPYVDIENLRTLEKFLIGYKIIEIESSDLFNIKDVVTLEIEENESRQKSFFIISNLPRKDIQALSKVKGLHCIINTSANLTDLKTQAFILYNKKRQQFVNYPMEEQDLTFEKKIFAEKNDDESYSSTLDKIHEISKKLVYKINAESNKKKVSEILEEYSKEEAQKIIEYTLNFYGIEASVLDLEMVGNTKHSANNSNGNRTIDSTISEEYQKIISSNKMLSAEFVPTLHDYRFNNVNESNLDLDELYSPESLYIYLRKHHWKDGIPKDFLKEWLKMENTGYKLTEQDILDFEILLNELKVPTKTLLNIMDTKNLNKKHEKPLIKQENPFSPKNQKETMEKKIRDMKKRSSEAIPSVEDFENFKVWILRKLDNLEHSLDKNFG